MQERNPPFKHQSFPKTRTGCLTCKRRRIKCDEGKPECQRCQKSLLRCDGYMLKYVSASTASAKKALLPLLRPAPLVYPPNTPVSPDPEERRYFYLYCQNSATILSGHYHSEFWSKLVPQEGRHSEPVRHGVAALTSLLKLLETSTRSPLRINASTKKDEKYLFFIKQYDQALKSLKQLLATKGLHHRTALIASLIFTSIESLQGDLVTATQHVYGAFSMAVEARALDLKGCKTLPVDDGLFDMLVGLEYQSKLPSFYAVRRPQSRSPTILLAQFPHPIPTVPTAFSNVGAAKKSMDHLLQYISYCTTGQPQIVEGSGVTSYKQLTLLREWEVSFLTLYQSAITEETNYRARIAYLILISTHALALIIVKSEAARCSEMLYDTLKPEYQQIIKVSQEILEVMPSNPLPNFVFEVGVLPPLHVAAMKCRIPRLRRELIRLLRSFPGQEGLWEGHGSAETCSWIMELEESGAASGLLDKTIDGTAEDAGLIPEWDRVRVSGMICNLDESRVWAQCTSVLPVAHGEHRVWEKTFTW